MEATALVAPTLLLAVALGRFWVGPPVLPLVAGRSLAPLFPAVPHNLVVERIGTNLVAIIFTPASMLAGELAADGLLRTISRRLEESLAVTTTAIIHQAAPGQNRNRSF
jgi:hypothetical protein